MSAAAGALLAGPAVAGAPSVSLRPQARPAGGLSRAARAPDAQALIDAAQLGGAVGYAVVDVRTGNVLESHNPAQGFAPASVTKAITALYGIRSLGAGYRFRTRLIATRAVENGVIKGDLILAGGGDPTLDTDALAGMAADLKAAGIRAVDGAFRVFGDALPYTRVIDADQPDHVGYNPTISGLNLNFNRVHFAWQRGSGGYTVTMDARSGKYRPEVRVARMRVANRQSPLYTYTDGGDHDAWTVAQGALGNSGTRWLPVRRPAEYAGEVFAGFARSQGIDLKMGSPLSRLPRGTALVTHQSAALSIIVRDMLKYSNNLTAELVGMTATAARKGSVASLAASGREMSTWAQANLGLRGARLVDHSGLGPASSVTPQALAQAMAAVYAENVLGPLMKPFTMRHKDGQVNNAHPVTVQAKTGTLFFVSTLSGYATGPDGRPLAFAILSANNDLRRGLNKNTQGRPAGASAWNKRAKALQQALIERWDAAYTG
ncbi:D-alanyl-D-alanine carboxypeptidase/D-alanyl-D-alanine endopeptidase [Roseovarius carneus]|uniref:D-alanyl-D-alanine carboxypeptidase/D-alanyl-D-alanine endopeptidase n=1 Tax=Roseovarius carneus TaxID=2853164 RepID=UPI0029622D36|nr:D-alanyl-D-alanine carboxypeptidase/D-alanyl-D-alanine-endopeptidase [Roseovarius carneus]